MWFALWELEARLNLCISHQQGLPKIPFSIEFLLLKALRWGCVIHGYQFLNSPHLLALNTVYRRFHGTPSIRQIVWDKPPDYYRSLVIHHCIGFLGGATSGVSPIGPRPIVPLRLRSTKIQPPQSLNPPLVPIHFSWFAEYLKCDTAAFYKGLQHPSLLNPVLYGALSGFCWLSGREHFIIALSLKFLPNNSNRLEVLGKTFVLFPTYPITRPPSPSLWKIGIYHQPPAGKISTFRHKIISSDVYKP